MRKVFFALVLAAAVISGVSCEFKVFGMKFDMRVDTSSDLYAVRFYALTPTGRYKQIYKISDLREGEKISIASMPEASRVEDVGLTGNSPNVFYQKNDVCIFNGLWNTFPDGSGETYTEVTIHDKEVKGSFGLYAQYEVKGKKRGNGSGYLIGGSGEIEEGRQLYVLKREVEEDLPEGASPDAEPVKHTEYALFWTEGNHASGGCEVGSDGFVRPDDNGTIEFECGLFKFSEADSKLTYGDREFLLSTGLQTVYTFDNGIDLIDISRNSVYHNQNLIEITFYGNDEWGTDIPVTCGVLYEFTDGSGNVADMHVVRDNGSNRYALLSYDPSVPSKNVVWYRDGFVDVPASGKTISFPNDDEDNLTVVDFITDEKRMTCGLDVYVLSKEYNVTLRMSDDRSEMMSLKRKGVVTEFLSEENVWVHHIPDGDPLCGELYIFETEDAEFTMINPGFGDSKISNIATNYLNLGVPKKASSGKVTFDANTSYEPQSGKFTFWGKSATRSGVPYEGLLYRNVNDSVEPLVVIKFEDGSGTKARWVFSYSYILGSVLGR